MAFKLNSRSILGLEDESSARSSDKGKQEELLRPASRRPVDMYSNPEDTVQGSYVNPVRGTKHTKESVGASGRYQYSDVEMQKVLYNMPPMDEVKLQQVMDKKGNWVAAYQDLIHRYSLDQINALMHGGKAHFQTQYGQKNGFEPGEQHMYQDPGQFHPQGPGGRHAIQYNLAHYASAPTQQGNKKQGPLHFLYKAHKSEGHASTGSSREMDRPKSSVYSYVSDTMDIVPDMNGYF